MYDPNIRTPSGLGDLTTIIGDITDAATSAVDAWRDSRPVTYPYSYPGAGLPIQGTMLPYPSSGISTNTMMLLGVGALALFLFMRKK